MSSVATLRVNRTAAHILTAVKGDVLDQVPIKRALISVSDKTGLLELAKALAAHGVEILSTGGSAKAMRDAGVPVRDVSDYTGFPEMMDGRVKTLHPKIHGGLLAVRGNAKHEVSHPASLATWQRSRQPVRTTTPRARSPRAHRCVTRSTRCLSITCPWHPFFFQGDMDAHGISAIDLVVLNLYPFEATVAKGSAFDECIENVDIGGPSMLRSASKNHKVTGGCAHKVGAVFSFRSLHRYQFRHFCTQNT